MSPHSISRISRIRAMAGHGRHGHWYQCGPAEWSKLLCNWRLMWCNCVCAEDPRTKRWASSSLWGIDGSVSYTVPLCSLYESVCCACICFMFVGLPVSFCSCPFVCVIAIEVLKTSRHTSLLLEAWIFSCMAWLHWRRQDFCYLCLGWIWALLNKNELLGLGWPCWTEMWCTCVESHCEQ